MCLRQCAYFFVSVHVFVQCAYFFVSICMSLCTFSCPCACFRVSVHVFVSVRMFSSQCACFRVNMQVFFLSFAPVCHCWSHWSRVQCAIVRATASLPAHHFRVVRGLDGDRGGEPRNPRQGLLVLILDGLQPTLKPRPESFLHLRFQTEPRPSHKMLVLFQHKNPREKRRRGGGEKGKRKR